MPRKGNGGHHAIDRHDGGVDDHQPKRYRSDMSADNERGAAGKQRGAGPNDSHRASGHPLGQTVTKRYENPA